METSGFDLDKGRGHWRYSPKSKQLNRKIHSEAFMVSKFQDCPVCSWLRIYWFFTYGIEDLFRQNIRIITKINFVCHKRFLTWNQLEIQFIKNVGMWQPCWSENKTLTLIDRHSTAWKNLFHSVKVSKLLPFLLAYSD